MGSNSCRVDTSPSEADALLARLSHYKQVWVQVPLERRIEYLTLCLTDVRAAAEPWVEAACAVKGLDPQMSIAGEEWIAGPFTVLRYLRLLIRTLSKQRASQFQTPPETLPKSSSPQPLEHPPDIQRIQTFPYNLFDRLLYRGITAQVWVQSDQPLQESIQNKAVEGAVALVLGAGNISSIGPLDVLHQLFIDNRVALLKMNPVNAAVGPWIEKAFAKLQVDGFFEIAYGDADLGAYLCQHSAVDAVHITGAQQTHDTIVWGRSTDQIQRKTAQSPLLQKPITSELGGATPILVVPGQWSDQEIDFQSRHVASMVTHNASFNCVAGQVLILSKEWPQRSQFLDRLRQHLRQVPPRLAYYPGAQTRYQDFLDRYPASEVLGQTAKDCIPWTLIPNVPPAAGEYALTTEAFCGLIAEVSLETAEMGLDNCNLVQDSAAQKSPHQKSPHQKIAVEGFLRRAVEFTNECIYGTLSCTVLVDPKTQQQSRAALDLAIAQLRYGTIGINIWSGALFAMPEIPWGAFPGNTLEDIGSGQGFVHNTCLIKNPQKAVVSAPFSIWPTPAWFAQHRTLHLLGRRLVEFEYRPNWQTLSAVVLAAIGG
jgi:Aldehyde dehydrogenase family